MEKLKQNIGSLIGGLTISIIFTIIGGIVGYDAGISKSLPGLLILAAMALGGMILSYVIPTKKISSILWISLIAILVSLPVSPVSEQVIYYTGQVSLMAVVTPILGYAGILVGKDWAAFKKLGIKAVIVSVVVMAGTFLVSGLLGDFFMKILG